MIIAPRISTISPGLCRAARGLLDWSQQELAKQAGVGTVTIRELESGRHEPRRATLYVVLQAFEKAGVEFLRVDGGGPGVRLRMPDDSKPNESDQDTA
jgi:transcriptional regulator with XRE-family HTH domain